jgi:hypothetical protein
MSDAPAIYIAPDGTDDAPGTELQPVHTLDRAAALARPGSTIYYADGIHRHLTQQTTTRNGRADARITICPAPGAQVTIDGGGGIDGTSPLVMLDGNYVTFRDIEVQRSARQGIAIYAATGVEVLNCVVHDCWGTGIISEGPRAGSNTGTLIDGCIVYHNVNHNLTGEPGFGQGISLSTGTGGTVRNCSVFQNMGEGIGVMKGHSGALLEGNVSYDNYKINIYTDAPASGASTTIHGNHCFCTGNPKYLTYGEQHRSTGITLARETGTGHVNGVDCADNTITDCHYGISFFEQKRDSGLTNGRFARNVIVDSVVAAWHIEPSGAADNEISDSVFVSTNGAPLFAGDLTGFVLRDNFCHPPEPAV